MSGIFKPVQGWHALLVFAYSQYINTVHVWLPLTDHNPSSALRYSCKMTEGSGASNKLPDNTCLAQATLLGNSHKV